MHGYWVRVLGEKRFYYYLLGLASLCSALTLANASELTCHDAYKTIQFVFKDKKHLIYHELDLDLIQKTVERFTQGVLDDFFIVLTDEEKERIKTFWKNTQPIDVLHQLQKEDCRYFEKQMSIAHDAVVNAQKVYFSVDHLSSNVLQSQLENLEKNKPTISRKVMQQFALWKNILVPEEAATNTAFWFLHRLDQLNARSQNPYVDLLKGFAKALDPHSDYFNELEARSIDETEEPAFSVSALFAPNPYGAQVTKTVGDSKAQSLLKPGDIIFEVNYQKVTGFDPDEILDLMTKKEQTSVLLSVGEIQKGRLTALRHLQLPLEEINLGKLSVTSFERKKINGVSVVAIHLDDFNKNSAHYVKQVVEDLQKEGPIDALILDLRSNPGGHLQEAVRLMGLFITQGPVGKTVSFKVRETLEDLDPVKIYSGPLVIAINDATSSAAEHVAGSLKALNRALIVGGAHTYGKGTAQITYFSKDHPNDIVQGAFKITEDRFYAVDGSSPQKKGISSQIEVPGPSPDQDDEEKDQKYPILEGIPLMPFFTTTELGENMDAKLQSLIPKLRKVSQKRVAGDPEFQAFQQKKTVSSDFQLREIENIAADYSILTRSK